MKFGTDGVRGVANTDLTASFALDLGRVFPVVKDALPSQLLVLEVASLALAGVVVTLAIKGLVS
jgi:phosphomannomutase